MSLWRAAFPNLWRSVGNPRVAKTWAENSKVRVQFFFLHDINGFSGSRERKTKKTAPRSNFFSEEE